MINKNPGDPISFTDIKNEFGLPPDKNLGAYRMSVNVGGLSNLALDNVDDIGQTHRPLTSIMPQSGTIKFSDFYQKRLNVIVDYYSGGPEVESKNNVNIKTGYKQYKAGKVKILGFKSSPPSNTGGTKIIIHVNKKLSRSSSGEDGNKKITLRTGGAWEEGTQLRVDVGSEGRIFGAGGKGGLGGQVNTDGKPGKDGTSALGMAFTGDVHVHPGGKIIGGGGGGGGGGGAGQKDKGDPWRRAGGGGGGGGQGVDNGLGNLGGYEEETNGGTTTEEGKFKRGKPGKNGDSEQGGTGGDGGNNHNEAFGGKGGAGFGAIVTMQNNNGEKGFRGDSDQEEYTKGGAGGKGGSSVRRKDSNVSFNVYNAGLMVGNWTQKNSNMGFN